MSQVKHQGWIVLISLLIFIGILNLIRWAPYHQPVKEYIEIRNNLREIAERTRGVGQPKEEIYIELHALQFVVQELNVNIELVRNMTDWEFDRLFGEKK